MGVYIKGMEMPKNGSCIQIVIDDDGKVYPTVEKCIMKMGSIAKVVPVPPHGRLIDADALIEDLKYDVELDAVALDDMEIVGDERRKIQDDKDFKQNCIFWIEDAPAIIAAEEVYGQYIDTAGNYHWVGTHSGEHTIKKKEGE